MARRIVAVPFTYDLTFRPPRARNPRQAYVRDQVDVSVRELDETDFPVVARISDGMQEIRYNQVDELHHDGLQFYRPLVYETVDTRVQIESDVFARLDHRSDESTPFRGATGRKHFGTPTVTRAEVEGEKLGDNRAAIILAIQHAAASTVVCNGLVFVACGEPCYRYVGGGFGPSYLRPELVDVHEPTAPETLVRPDRLELWHAAQFPEGDGPNVDVYGTLEVLRPELLRLSVSGPALLLCAERFVASAGRHLEEIGVEDFAAYAGLRDALRKCKGRKPDGHFLQVLDVVMQTPAWDSQASYAGLRAKLDMFQSETLPSAHEPLQIR